jgi:hypothetical protein
MLYDYCMRDNGTDESPCGLTENHRETAIWMSYLLSRYKGDKISEKERLENEITSSCKEYVEYHYVEISTVRRSIEKQSCQF